MRRLYPLLIALVLFSSGCAFNGGTANQPVDAIVVNSFSVDPPVLETDDVASFFLDIENVGGTTATCITSELYGIEQWYRTDGQPLYYNTPWNTRGLGFSYNNGRIDFSIWDAQDGFISFGYDRQAGMGLSAYINDAWGQFSGRLCNSAGRLQEFQTIKYFDSMQPAVPAQNKPGQSYTMEWLLRPPVLPEGVQQTYGVTARTSYLYTTNAHINLQAYNKAEQQRREVLGQAGDMPIVVETSYASPINIVATRGVNPIIVNQRQPGFELVNYLFEFQNNGNGWPLPFESDSRGQNGFIFATVELNGPGASFYDCLGANNGNEIFVYGDVIQNLVKIRQDRSAPFGCTIAIDRNQWIDAPIGAVSLTFKVWYRYYTDAHTTVDVLGLQQNA